MNPHPIDDRLRLALERFVAHGGSFVVPDGAPPTALLPEPPGGLPADTKLMAALPTPATIPRPPRRDPAANTPPPRGRAVVTADAVLAALDLAVWSVSPDGRVVFLLDGAVQDVFGRPAEYYLDDPDGWLAAVDDADRPALRAAFGAVTMTGGFAVEHRCGGRRVVSRGRLVRRPDGSPARVDGTTAELAETAAERDLRARLAAAEERAAEAGRLGTLGRLVAGVAHDVTNCLTVVSGNAQLIRDLLPPGDAVRERAEEIVEHVGTAAVVTRQLIAVGRPSPADAGPTCPTAEVRALERLLRRLAGDVVRVDVLLTPGIHPVAVGAGAFAQVLLNLVANARDAIPGRGYVTVRTAEVDVEPDRPGWPPASPAGRYVALTVSDTGRGMTEDVRARMFDPYFSTKGTGGNGVGLATVADIVRRAGGHIEVKSRVGWGTSVRVFFPTATGPAPVAPPPASVPRPTPATLLLVQDDVARRDLGAVALQHAGYRVLEADDVLAGEERARLYAGAIDLLVTDATLHGRSGAELAATLRVARPALKVLFLSGTDAVEAGYVLTKPYGTDELLAAVGRALAH